MVGNAAIVPRAWVCSHNLFHTPQAIKTGSGFRNEAARRRMLALFQNKETLLSWSDSGQAEPVRLLRPYGQTNF